MLLWDLARTGEYMNVNYDIKTRNTNHQQLIFHEDDRFSATKQQSTTNSINENRLNKY